MESRQVQPETAKINEHSMEINSRLSEVGSIIAEILALAKNNGWDESAIAEMHIGLDEAIKNAIVHGNLLLTEEHKKSGQSWENLVKEKLAQEPELAGKKVSISWRVSPEKVVITIKDQGQGFAVAEVADPTQADRLNAEQGRGILIMKQACFDQVEYNEQGNEVILVKARKQ